EVEGRGNRVGYSGKGAHADYPATKAPPSPAPVATAAAALGKGTLDLPTQIAAGGVLFKGTCSVCHQAAGQGIPSVFPPLAKSDFLMADKRRSVEIVLKGLNGPVTVNGQSFNSSMPPMSQLRDDEIANILTFVRNSWGNQGEPVTAKEVSDTRATVKLPPGAAH